MEQQRPEEHEPAEDPRLIFLRETVSGLLPGTEFEIINPEIALATSDLPDRIAILVTSGQNEGKIMDIQALGPNSQDGSMIYGLFPNPRSPL